VVAQTALEPFAIAPAVRTLITGLFHGPVSLWRGRRGSARRRARFCSGLRVCSRLRGHQGPPRLHPRNSWPSRPEGRRRRLCRDSELAPLSRSLIKLAPPPPPPPPYRARESNRTSLRSGARKLPHIRQLLLGSPSPPFWLPTQLIPPSELACLLRSLIKRSLLSSRVAGVRARR